MRRGYTRRSRLGEQANRREVKINLVDAAALRSCHASTTDFSGRLEGLDMARIPGGRRSTASHTEPNESDVSAQEEEELSLSKSQTKKEKSARSSSRTSLKRSRTEFQAPAVQDAGQKARCLLYNEEQEEAFVKALKDLSSINKLTVSGEGLHASNEFGETYLHFAAFTGRPDLVILLILMFEDNVLVKVKWLLDKGAHCDARDNKGRSPLARCASGDVDCVKILIQRGADVDLADNEGITPLHYAALSQSFANLKLLLEAGAQINSYDKVNGCAPLHDACYGGDLKCVKVRQTRRQQELRCAAGVGGGEGCGGHADESREVGQKQGASSQPAFTHPLYQLLTAPFLLPASWCFLPGHSRP
eukprot:13751-Hanusia_phi.AAC.3